MQVMDVKKDQLAAGLLLRGLRGPAIRVGIPAIVRV